MVFIKPLKARRRLSEKTRELLIQFMWKNLWLQDEKWRLLSQIFLIKCTEIIKFFWRPLAGVSLWICSQHHLWWPCTDPELNVNSLDIAWHQVMRVNSKWVEVHGFSSYKETLNDQILHQWQCRTTALNPPGPLLSYTTGESFSPLHTVYQTT